MCSQSDEPRSDILIQENEFDRTNYGIHISSPSLPRHPPGLSLHLTSNTIKNQHHCAIHLKNLFPTSLTLTSNSIKNCSISGISLSNLRCLTPILFYSNTLFNNPRLGLNLDTTFTIKIKDCKFQNSKCGIWYISKLSNFLPLPQSLDLETAKLFTGRVSILGSQFVD